MTILNKEETENMILDKMKDIATLFDRHDGKTEDAMISMYISEDAIDITAFDPMHECANIFHIIYWRDTGEIKRT